MSEINKEKSDSTPNPGTSNRFEEILKRMQERSEKRRAIIERLVEPLKKDFKCQEQCRNGLIEIEGEGIAAHIECPGKNPDCEHSKYLAAVAEREEHRQLNELEVPKKFWSKGSFAKSKPSNTIEIAKKYFEQGLPKQKCLILLGETDSSKTHAAICILRAQMAQAGIEKVAYYYAPFLWAKFMALSFEEKFSLLKHLKKVPLLVIDDLKFSSIDKACLEYLDIIIDHRDEAMATVITTNASADQFKSVFGERAAERLLNHNWSTVVPCAPTDMRKQKQ